MVAAAVRPFTELTNVMPDDGGRRLDIHPHAGQWRALESTKRYVVILAGTQSGKTSLGPLWLHQEMRSRGPGDYMVITPTFPLLEIKALPEFRRLFEVQLRLGEYRASPIRHFTISSSGERSLWGSIQDVPTNVYFGYADDPESLESATVKAAWLDEAGQRRFKRGSWEAIQRRLSLNEGRALITTTPYDLGWLKQTFWDPWVAASQNHPDIDVINFPSTANPRFPQAELERAQRDLPRWKFRMFYLGQFERPAGLIYDNFQNHTGEGGHVVKAFTIPNEWPRFQGADFGGVNTAALFLAQELDAQGKPVRRFYAYREYLVGSLTARQHADRWRSGEPRLPKTVGGSHSEDQWRNEFRAAAYPIGEPDIKDVEVGIDRVYGMIGRDELLVFDTLTMLRDEMTTYSRVLDANGDPTEKIEEKETYHLLDSLRYVGGWLNRQRRELVMG